MASDDNGVALRRGDVAGVTHWIEWDAIGRVRVRALCGAWVRRTDHRNTPTCPDCQAALARRDALRF